MVFDDEARQPLAAGVEKLARAVRSTLGPRGRNAVLDKGWGSPKVTKDGVTVAEDIELDDPYENLGAQLVKEAASKTNDVAGDGTTTATVLAEAIFREGLKMIAAGADPMALSRGIHKAVAAVSRSDREDGRRRSTRRTRRKCSKSPPSRATTTRRSATCWPTRSSRSARTASSPSKKAAATKRPSKWSKGMQFDRGYLSPHFVTNEDDMTVELENCYILIYEEKISNAKNLVPLLEAISKANKPLLIIAEDVEGEALATLVVNKLRGILQRVCGEGPRLRRSPQGHAGRHRRADRRQGDLQGPGHRARRRAS